GRLPIEAVMPSGRADQFLGIFGDAIVIPIALGVVLPLGNGVSAASSDCGKLILANPAVQRFFKARVCVEKPFAVLLNERDRHWPIVVPDRHGEFGIVHLLKLSGLADGGSELFEVLAVLDFVSGKQFVVLWSEDLGERIAIFLLGRGDEGLQSVVRRRKRGLRLLLGVRVWNFGKKRRGQKQRGGR